MNLQEKLSQDLKEAMRAGDHLKTSTLRLLNSALKNRAIEKKSQSGSEQLTDDEVLPIISKEAKKRQESIEMFSKANRDDLADKEKLELKILSVYLPKQLSSEEVEKEIDGIIKNLSSGDFGAIMKEAARTLKGKADGKLISEIVKKKLGS